MTPLNPRTADADRGSLRKEEKRNHLTVSNLS
jgi:hypothetical protein